MTAVPYAKQEPLQPWGGREKVGTMGDRERERQEKRNVKTGRGDAGRKEEGKRGKKNHSKG